MGLWDETNRRAQQKAERAANSPLRSKWRELTVETVTFRTTQECGLNEPAPKKRKKR